MSWSTWSAPGRTTSPPSEPHSARSARRAGAEPVHGSRPRIGCGRWVAASWTATSRTWTQGPRRSSTPRPASGTCSPSPTRTCTSATPRCSPTTGTASACPATWPPWPPSSGRRTGGPVLDVGCGAGHLTWALTEHTDAPVIGVDGLFFALYVAKTRIAPAADFVCGELESLPLADGTVGGIWASDVLHAVNRKVQVARELARVATEGSWGAVVGLAVAGHDHEYPGRPLSLEGYRRLLPDDATLVADDALVDGYLEGRAASRADAGDRPHGHGSVGRRQRRRRRSPTGPTDEASCAVAPAAPARRRHPPADLPDGVVRAGARCAAAATHRAEAAVAPRPVARGGRAAGRDVRAPRVPPGYPQPGAWLPGAWRLDGVR